MTEKMNSEDKEATHKDQGVATSVAKTVGGVAAVSAKPKKTSNPYTVRASALKKEKSAKHHRKLGRRTKG